MLVFLSLFLHWASAESLINDTFSRYKTTTWTEGSTQGPWLHEYHGYGQVGVQFDTGKNKVLFQKPKASTSPDETHASLVLSQAILQTPTVTYRSKVVKQLRTPKPFPWETAWLVWNYKDDHRFYYFALKTNGWELGKVDNSKIDPKGPDCLWPEYRNCKYDGAQRFLATGGSPKVGIGSWQKIKMSQSDNKFQVYVNDKLVVAFTDNKNPYLAGRVGFYNEDAHVRFDDVRILDEY
jgi:hypothetical protein